MALGQKLKQARLDRGLTTSEIAAVTRMKTQMVEDLENEDFSKVAATIYGKGFIRLVSEQVGLDSAPLIEEYLTRFVAPENGGIRPDTEPEEPQHDIMDEDEEEDDGNDIVSRVMSFFKKSADEEDEQEEAASIEAKKTFTPRPTHKEEPVQVFEPAAEPEPIPTIEPATEETISSPKDDSSSVASGEDDLFSFSKDAKVSSTTRSFEPTKPARPTASVISGKPKPVQPEEKVEEKTEDAGPSLAESLGEKLDVINEVGMEYLRRFQKFSGEQLLDLRITCKKMTGKLPDFKTFELSLTSMPVMIAIIVIVVLLISGLSSLVRKANVEPVEADVSPPIEQPQELNVVINPPEPYYK
jgi:transcriptional regulator with XRE-family HTH domain